MAVCDLAADITSTSQPTQVVEVALDSVERWQRGDTNAAVSPPDADHSAVRITLDSRGIHSIQRIPQRPAFRQNTSKYQAYIVEDIMGLAGVKVYIKVFKSLSATKFIKC